MEAFAGGIRQVHVIFGFVGLAAFWVPVFSRKGGKRHVFFGKIFEICAYVVLAGAALSVLYRIFSFSEMGMPLDNNSFAFIFFLGYLTWVTFVGLRHALGVLRKGKNPDALATSLNKVAAASCIVASLLLIAYTIVYRPEVRIVLFALSPIGLGIGFGILKYLRGEYDSKRQWMYEHLGGMLGTGIAFHTAFAVFGSTRLFDVGLTGWVAVIPWVAPAAIGIPATIIWTRHLRRRFGELGMQVA